MTDWLLVLTVLSVAAVLACFRFAGCALFYNYSGYTVTDYVSTITDEISLLAYWRLGEPSTTAAGDFPTAGDTAKDEIGSTPSNPTGDHPGTYQKIFLAADPAFQSPETAMMPILNAGQQGLLPSDPSATSVQVDGGFVSVPFSSTFNPDPDKPFSVEAWVNAEWDTKNEQNVFRCVVASRQDTGPGLPKFGYMIYAGPKLDPTTFTTTDSTMHWQAWVGDGTTWQMLVMDEQVEIGQTYLILCWNGDKTINLDVFPITAGMRRAPAR